MYVGALTGTHADVGELVALCDPNPVRMDHYRQNYPGLAEVPTYAPEELDRLLAETRPEALIVTSPDATHDRYITAALEHGIDAITEKPMTIDAPRLHRIVDAVHASPGDLTVTFNYRYSPRNSVVRQLIAEGAIGQVTSVHFEWLLDTAHGADYFRRWHRLKDVSGGLLVHKSTHHFDLVNWWLADAPTRVYASGGLKFYGRANADARGLGERTPLSRDNAADDPFRLDMAADPQLTALYLNAEHVDGYQRDLDVFNDSISIEDSLHLLVDYAGGATMSYTLSAYGPWEGYRVAFTGTEGRIELDVVERGHLASANEKQKGVVVDPSAVHDEAGSDQVRPVGERVLLQRHWEPAREIEIPAGVGGHGGGDAMLLDDLFRGATHDPLGRAAGYLDGIRSVIVGVAGNTSLAERRPVETPEFGLPRTEAAAAGVTGADATEPSVTGARS
jgi:predicted dehydrogenase